MTGKCWHFNVQIIIQIKSNVTMILSLICDIIGHSGIATSIPLINKCSKTILVIMQFY